MLRGNRGHPWATAVQVRRTEQATHHLDVVLEVLALPFPQHGPGKKHLRTVALAPWQVEIVERDPGRFARGLIHSDGWRGVNRVTAKGRRYSYPRYQFSSRSDDIRQLFIYVCALLGVECRRWGKYHISVARSASVQRLDEFVGPKA